MPCYHPLEGYRSKTVNPNTGKRSIVFSKHQGYVDQKVQVPCGQCIGCRLERSRQWAIRCVHEAQMHQNNCFITLTYSDENLPPNNSLVLEDFQKFMKRLRKKLGKGIRFFHCGEYGERFKRPHYHACLFGADFADKQVHASRNGHKYYVSETLQQLWPHGFSMIGEVNFETAAYVARYIMKKVTGKKAIYHYSEVDLDTGEIKNERKKEYTTMSRRPGLGSSWFENYQNDIYSKDYVVIRGKKMKSPKFYDRKYEIVCDSDYNKIKGKRKKLALLNKSDNTLRRLAVKEYCKKEQIKQLKRSYENEESVCDL